MYAFKPYKDIYVLIMALIDEAGVIVCMGVVSTTVFTNNLSPQDYTVLSYAYGITTEVILLLNVIFLFIYYKKRNPPELDFDYNFDSPQ